MTILAKAQGFTLHLTQLSYLSAFLIYRHLLFSLYLITPPAIKCVCDSYFSMYQLQYTLTSSKSRVMSHH